MAERKVVKAPPVRRAVSGPRKSLRARRREERRKTGLIALIVLIVLTAVFFYAVWLPALRIQSVDASSAPNPAQIAGVVLETLKGTYGYVLPKDSFLFFPERTAESAVLLADPTIATASITRTGFTSLSVRTTLRSAAFLWCGAVHGTAGSCYEADADGFVFAPAPHEDASSSLPMLTVYGALDSATTTLRAHVLGAEHVPDILRFSRAVESLGVPIESIAIRDDEADLYAASGTRITYVIGHEAQATEDAQAAFPQLNFADGSLIYVDLRFDGKVYLKRKGE